MTGKIRRILLRNDWHILRPHYYQQPRENLPLLLKCAEAAQKDLLHAEAIFRTALEPELIDYACYLIKAHESYCLYLTRRVQEAKGAKERK